MVGEGGEERPVAAGGVLSGRGVERVVLGGLCVGGGWSRAGVGV